MFLAKGNLVVKKQGGWQAVGLTSDPGLIEFRFQSGRGLPQSKTLPRVTQVSRWSTKLLGLLGRLGPVDVVARVGTAIVDPVTSFGVEAEATFGIKAVNQISAAERIGRRCGQSEVR